MPNHSKLSPSSAARRVACPGSRALEEKYPQQETPKSREGDAAHWVASEMLRGNNVKLNTPAPNGELITEEMIAGALLFKNKIIEDAGETELHIEETLPIPHIHRECFGTPDCWFMIVKDDVHYIHIYDYKFGHAPVEVYENYQLIEYAAGVFEKFKPYNFNTYFKLTIIQPRSFHVDGPVRTWCVTTNTMNEYWNLLIDAEEKSLSADAVCIPNPDCRYCSARAACTALQTASYHAVEISQQSSHELTAQQLGNELRLLEHYAKLLNARITGLQEEALSLIQNGETIPHYMLDYTRPRQQWIKSKEEIIELGKLFNIDVVKPPELITPLQAVDRGLPKELLSSYVDRPLGSPKLIPHDTKKMKILFNNKEG